MRAHFLTVVAFILLTAVSAYPDKDSGFFPGTEYDPSVPTLAQVVGHGWGEGITTHAELEDYLQALAGSSKRARLFTYGRTWEGRTLYYLVIGAEERLEKLEELKRDLRALAHPLSLGEAEKKELASRLPVVTWIAANIHGNEPSGGDAALFLAYHLLAAKNNPVVDKIFRESIVILDPLQNPDGRDRFANYFRSTTGRWPASDPVAAEHREPWPGGRTNHYLFDMNRDWFAMTQAETRGKVEAYFQWYPHIFIDLHEMETDREYYFPPTAPPINSHLAPQQVKWFAEFGKNTAGWFDRFGFKYCTGEMFDAYFPGYGCTWPSMSGSIGMTYEEASSRGLVTLKSNEILLPYSETVRHHAVASLATAQFAADNREKILTDYLSIRTPPETVPRSRAYLITEQPDPSRTRKLVSILLKQGIEVQKAAGALDCRSLVSSDKRKVSRITFPPGTYVVPARQEAYALLSNLLEPEVSMDQAYISEQERRLAAGLETEVYDITAWSLPTLYGVDCYRTDNLPPGDYRTVDSLGQAQTPQKKSAGLAYLLDGTGNGSMVALACLFRHQVRVYVSDRAFTQNERKFPRGSFIIPVKENAENLPETIAKIEEHHGVEFYPTDSGWMAEGVNFGSPNVQYLPGPKVLLAWGEGTHSYSAGWCRYVLEQQYGVPVTAVKPGHLGRIRLDRFNVLVLPNGGYKESIDKDDLNKIKKWLEQGGTVVGVEGATSWLSEPEVGLLEAAREYRLDEDTLKAKKDSEEKEKSSRVPGSEIKDIGEFSRVIVAEKREPRSVPGILARIRLDPDHWLSSGYDSTAVAFVQGWQIYSPLKRSQGRNVAFFAEADNLLVSGYSWKGPGLKQLAFKPYLMYRPVGEGHVIGFTEEPNFRAVCDGTNRLFMNAVLLGPGH
ncbi:MAG TPA: M14 family zinc carboxypeptidase [archaeon]|nr:M14 family zinc carboxypeptidase [archaeon]